MTHAGLLPRWSLAQAEALAAEVQAVLGRGALGAFLERMYGNAPACWRDDLDGIDRLRAIVNVLTRMRFIDADGCLDFTAKEGLDSAPRASPPGSSIPRDADDPWLLFGHWAALQGETPRQPGRRRGPGHRLRVGGRLTALDLQSGRACTSVPSRRRCADARPPPTTRFP
jgi:bis(5'-nucleosyl)-tetraphosphatase (symmetrical)